MESLQTITIVGVADQAIVTDLLGYFVLFRKVAVVVVLLQHVLLTMARLPILMSVFVHVGQKIAMLYQECIVMQQLVLVSRNHVHPENIGKPVVLVVQQ